MKAENIQAVIDDLNTESDKVQVVVICRDDKYGMVGDEFNAELVIGQLQMLIHILMSNKEEDPNFGQCTLDQDDSISEPPGLFPKKRGIH